jgi:hypothetical protein
MKETKLKKRIENAFNAFFENELLQNTAIVTAENQSLISPAPVRFEKNADKYFGYFKKLFAFAPGVLLLHLSVPATLMFDFSLWSLFWFVAGMFMVWAGIGDLKEKKHLLLPLSVIVAGLIFAAPFEFLPASFASYYVYFYIGILPLFFIAPILTKGLIDKYETSEN